MLHVCRYDAEFLGMLEDSADGLGAWAVGPPGGGERDMTVAGIVSAATVSGLRYWVYVCVHVGGWAEPARRGRCCRRTGLAVCAV